MTARLGEQDVTLFEEARQGNYTPFTERYFRLPFSGTWFTPEDRVQQYEMLHKGWVLGGRREDQIKLNVESQEVVYKVIFGEYGADPAFLLPHGYIFLPWFMQAIEAQPDIFVAEGGTGSAKTASVGVLAMTLCAIYPGFDFVNVAPTSKQANDMLREVSKWTTGAEFERFIVKPRGTSNRLYKQDQGVYVLVIDCGLGTYSTFRTFTLGENAGDISLGDECDWVNVDEAGLLQGINDTIPKLISRVRGTRRNGMPRHSRPCLSFLSNPHNNPSFDRLKNRAEEQMQELTEELHWYYANPSEDDNVYVTERQKKMHRGMMTKAQQDRWLKGQDTMFDAEDIISRKLMNLCYDEEMDRDIARAAKKGLAFQEIERMGITHYELPRRSDRLYAVMGDPGTGNLVSIDTQNVPVCTVWDVTDFPRAPVEVVALRIFDGGGRWEPWVEQMKHWIYFYQTTGGAYDATSAQSVLSEYPLQKFPDLIPVSLSGNNKAVGKTFFILMAGRKLFRWPYVERLWHEARSYRETGIGVNKLPDDILSAFFVGCYYLRALHYAELPDYLKAPLPNTQTDILEEMRKQAQKAEVTSRYVRTGGRYQRRS